MVELELGVCPMCGCASCRELSTEGGDYNESDQSVATVVLFQCNNCGSKFKELRYYGTVVITQGFYDEDGEEDDFTMFYGIPAAEYLDKLMRDPASCKTPSEVRASRMARELYTQHGGRDLDNLEGSSGYRDIDNLGGSSGYRDLDKLGSWDKKGKKGRKSKGSPSRDSKGKFVKSKGSTSAKSKKPVKAEDPSIMKMLFTPEAESLYQKKKSSSS